MKSSNQRFNTRMINDEMKKMVSEQRLGFMATVCNHGTPNLSPKGLTLTRIWKHELNVMIHFLRTLVTIFIVFLNTLSAYPDENPERDRVLHFDQPQTPLTSLLFKHDDELKPVPNDFRIIEVSYLSNNIGERWAIVTFKNKSAGQRFLKNEAIVATFADGVQVNSLNLSETFKGNERLTKAVFFGIHRFPIVSVQIE